MSNDYESFWPYFKFKHSKYIKVIHGNFQTYKKCKNITYFNDLVVLSSKELTKWQKRHKSVNVIANFIPQIPQAQSNYQTKNILSIGRATTNDIKGFLRLIEIFKLVQEDELCKNYTLTIIAEGENIPEIKNKIQAYKLDKQILLKPFTTEIEKEYLNSSIFVMCSHSEGLPMVLIEALSFGLSLVAFDINTGPSDIIEPNFNGYLIENDSLQDFALKLKNLIASEELRQKFGNNSKLKAKSEFSKEVILAKYLRLLKQ